MEPYLALEKEYSKFVGSKYGISCSSGTAALHLAFLSLNIGAGDEVIVPDFAMAACAFAVSYTGAKPVFVDVDQNYALDPKLIEERITRNTKAILVVHTYGRLAKMSEILKIAKKHKIFVVEDGSEAQGAIYKSKADITTYSFFKNKIINAEEGGIVTTGNKKIAARISYLKNMAFGPEHDYFHKEIGFNYRLPNTEADLALKSLKAFKKNNSKRIQIEGWYDKYLKIKMPKRDAVWFYDVFVPEKIVKKILKLVPGSRFSFKPLSTFPMYGSGIGFPNASKFSKKIIILPVAINAKEADIKRICDIVNSNI